MPCQSGNVHLNGENIEKAPFQARAEKKGWRWCLKTVRAKAWCR